MSCLSYFLPLLLLLTASRITDGSSQIKMKIIRHNQANNVTVEITPHSLTPPSNVTMNAHTEPLLHDRLTNHQRNAVNSSMDLVNSSLTTGHSKTTERTWNERQHNASKNESKRNGYMNDNPNSNEINRQEFGQTNVCNDEESLVNFNIPPSFAKCTLVDNILCSPCSCYLTLHAHVHATCTSKSTIEEIIPALRNNTVQVTISHSELHIFLVRDFVSLSELKLLNISGNRHIGKVGNSSRITAVVPVQHLDLSSNKIQSIDDRSFQAMPYLHTLILSHNKISRIGKFTFQGLHQLHRLNLSDNAIQLLENGSFDGLLGLQILDLSRNNGLGYERPLLPDILKSVASLAGFYFEGNYNSGNTYPNELIAQFRNLTELSIDLIGQDVTLKPEIKLLKNLTVLDVSCRNDNFSAAINVSGSFLKNMPYLHTVRFNKCPIEHVDPNVYTPVKNLTNLQFSYTYPYSIFRALEGLQMLHASSLKSLSLIGLVTYCPFIILAERHCKFLSKLRLEELDLSENRIGFIEDGFIRGLPLTLKRLVLHGNKLVEPRLLLSKLYFLEHLETLDLGMFSVDRHKSSVSEYLKGPGVFGEYLDLNEPDCSTQKEACYALYQYRSAALCRQQFSKFSVFCLDQKSESVYSNKDIDAAAVCDRQLVTRNVNLSRKDDPMPPNLRYLFATRFLEMNISGVFDMIRAAKNTSLEEVDVSHCALPNFPGVHTTIPPNIHAVNLEGNYFRHMPPYLFHYKNTLRYLNLANNVLGFQFSVDKTDLFRGLTHLVYLDISMNMIFELPSTLFSKLHRLNVLIMNKNKLHVVNITFSSMPRLQYLDLKKNSIGWISKHSRDELDLIRTSHPLYIDLSENPLRCTCEGLAVLIWIQTSNINFVSMDFLKCHRDDGSPEFVGDLDKQVTTLRRRCLGNDVITVISVASILIVLIVITLGLLYRFRWQLRYIRNIALSRIIGYKPRETASSGYKFDAFIVYSEMSRQFVFGDCLKELEVKRGHRLCVDDRDFMPGTYDVSAIVSAIQNSEKTVLILSPDFYNQPFSEYSVKMALMEEIYQKRSVLYLFVYRPIPDDEMSKSYDLLMIMNRNNYTEFPPETETSDEVRHNFWDQLSLTIGQSSISDMQSEVRLTEMA